MTCKIYALIFERCKKGIKKKRVPISSPKTLLSQKLASFLEMKRATRLSHKAVHDMKTVS